MRPQQLEPDLKAAMQLHTLLLNKSYSAALDLFISTPYRLECVIAREVDSQAGLLHVAISQASPEDFKSSISDNPQHFIEAFLRAGIYVDLEDKAGRTVLQIAAMRNLLPVVEAVVVMGAKRDKRGFEREMERVYGLVLEKMRGLREEGEIEAADEYREMACLLHGKRESGLHDDERRRKRRVHRPSVAGMGGKTVNRS